MVQGIASEGMKAQQQVGGVAGLLQIGADEVVGLIFEGLGDGIGRFAGKGGLLAQPIELHGFVWQSQQFTNGG